MSKKNSNLNFKKYKIIKQIGEGSFAKIFQIKIENSNKIFVLKQIKITQEDLNDSNNFSEIQNESKILSNLNNKFILKFYDSYFEKNTSNLNIITEFCNSGDLCDYLILYMQKNKKLNEKLIWFIFIQISLGLFYLHSKKILHRDIKTKNIFLNEDFSIKIGDLGVAKILKNTNSFAHTFIGTPYYLSPEVCKDLPYNDKSDVWAIGCVLYEMACLKHPFEGEKQIEIYSKIINNKYDDVDECYSKDLRKMIHILLNKNEEKRPKMKDVINMDIFIKKAKEVGIDLNLYIKEINNNNNNELCNNNNNEINKKENKITSQINNYYSFNEFTRNSKNKIRISSIDTNFKKLNSIINNNNDNNNIYKNKRNNSNELSSFSKQSNKILLYKKKHISNTNVSNINANKSKQISDIINNIKKIKSNREKIKSNYFIKNNNFINLKNRKSADSKNNNKNNNNNYYSNNNKSENFIEMKNYYKINNNNNKNSKKKKIRLNIHNIIKKAKNSQQQNNFQLINNNNNNNNNKNYSKIDIPLPKNNNQIKKIIIKKKKKNFPISNKNTIDSEDNFTLIENTDSFLFNSTKNHTNEFNNNNNLIESVKIYKENDSLLNKSDSIIKKEKNNIENLKEKYLNQINEYKNIMNNISKEIYNNVINIYQKLNSIKNNSESISIEIEKYIKENLYKTQDDYENYKYFKKAFCNYVYYDIEMKNINNIINNNNKIIQNNNENKL